MKVFLSWSKEESRKYADIFRLWIPKVIQRVDPFVSTQDIALGERGVEKIEEKLSDYSFGVLFVTAENAREPWLLYEAGALSRSLPSSQARLVPILIGIDRADITTSPLSHFQNAEGFSKDSILRLLKSINESVDESLSDAALEEAFQVWWPNLEEQITAISKVNPSAEKVTIEALSQKIDNLAEIIVAVRNKDHKLSAQFEELSYFLRRKMPFDPSSQRELAKLREREHRLEMEVVELREMIARSERRISAEDAGRTLSSIAQLRHEQNRSDD